MERVEFQSHYSFHRMEGCGRIIRIAMFTNNTSEKFAKLMPLHSPILHSKMAIPDAVGAVTQSPIER